MRTRLKELFDFYPPDINWNYELKDFFSTSFDHLDDLKGTCTINEVPYDIMVRKESYTSNSIPPQTERYLTSSGKAHLSSNPLYVFDFMFKAKGTFDITGSGNASLILSTMVNLFREATRLVKNIDIFCVFQIDAVQEVTSRIQLYDKFATKIHVLSPGLVFLASKAPNRSSSLNAWFMGLKDQKQFFEGHDARLGDLSKNKASLKKAIMSGNQEKIFAILDELFPAGMDLEESLDGLLDILYKVPHHAPARDVIMLFAMTRDLTALPEMIPLIKGYQENGYSSKIIKQLYPLLKSQDAWEGDKGRILPSLATGLEDVVKEDRPKVLEYIFASILTTSDETNSFYDIIKKRLTPEDIVALSSYGILGISIDLALSKLKSAIADGNGSGIISALKDLSKVFADGSIQKIYDKVSRAQIFSQELIKVVEGGMINSAITMLNWAKSLNSESLHSGILSRLDDDFLQYTDILKWIKANDDKGDLILPLNNRLRGYRAYHHYVKDEDAEGTVLEHLLKVFSLEDLRSLIDYKLREGELSVEELQLLHSLGVEEASLALVYKELSNSMHEGDFPSFEKRLATFFKSPEVFNDSKTFQSLTLARYLKGLTNLGTLLPPEFHIASLEAVNTIPSEDARDMFLHKVISFPILTQIPKILEWVLDNNIPLTTSEHQRVAYAFSTLPPDLRLRVLNYVLSSGDRETVLDFYKQTRHDLTSEELKLVTDSGLVDSIKTDTLLHRIEIAIKQDEFEMFETSVQQLFTHLEDTVEAIWEVRSPFKMVLLKLYSLFPKQRLQDYSKHLISIGNAMDATWGDQVTLPILYTSEIRSTYAKSPLAFKWLILYRDDLSSSEMASPLYQLGPDNIPLWKDYFSMFMSLPPSEEVLKVLAQLAYMIVAGMSPLPNSYAKQIYRVEGLPLFSRLNIILNMYEDDPKSAYPEIKDVPLWYQENPTLVRDRLINRIDSVDSADLPKAYSLFKLLSEKDKRFYTSELISSNPKAVNGFLDLAFRQKNYKTAWVLLEAILSKVDDVAYIKTLQRLIQGSIPIDPTKRIYDVAMVIKMLPLFAGTPLLGNFDVVFPNSRTYYYPKDLIEALARQKIISPEQLNPTMQATLAGQQPRAIANQSTRSSSPDPTQPYELTSETRRLPKKKSLIKEIGNFIPKDLVWSTPLDTFVMSSAVRGETFTSTPFTIRGSKYLVQIFKRQKEVPAIGKPELDIMITEYDFEFKDEDGKYNLTGNGNTPYLFSTMATVIKTLVGQTSRAKQDCYFTFEAIASESSRITLYDRFTKVLPKIIPSLMFLSKFKTDRGLWKWAFCRMDSEERLRSYTMELAEAKLPKTNKLTLSEVLDTPTSYTIETMKGSRNPTAKYTVGGIEYTMSLASVGLSRVALQDFLVGELVLDDRVKFLTIFDTAKDLNTTLMFFSFYAEIDGKSVMSVTNTGNTGVVLSNTVGFLSEMFKDNRDKPYAVTFSSDERELSRIKLYQAFYNTCSKLMPGVFQIRQPEAAVWVIGNSKFKDLQRTVTNIIKKDS